ncbi:hypothetical protein ABEU20_001544 [Rhodococcus sp. PAM 2766]|uniref:ABC transporter substrate-binding protein n=1 Tax=Rhodococcus parequi TaxID=3137122 RepID=A0ABW9FD30_9NOCA
MTLTVLVVGCSSGGDAAPVSESSTRAADLANVTVPDAYTGLVLAPTGDPTFPFLGSDGKYHVAYDLQLANATPVPATLDKIDVVETGAAR